MKEAYRSELTSYPSSSRLNNRGSIFMPEGNSGVVLENIRPNHSSEAIVTPDHLREARSLIKNPEMRIFAMGFEEKSRQKPLDKWGLDELHSSYRTLHRIEAAVDKSKIGKTLDESTEPPYQLFEAALRFEFESRVEKGQITEEEYRNFLKQVEKDYPVDRVKSLGAQTIPEDAITDTKLQDEMRVINGQLAIKEEGDIRGQMHVLEEALRKVLGATGVDRVQQDQLYSKIADRIRELRQIERRFEVERESIGTLYHERRLTDEEQSDLIKNIVENDILQETKVADRLFNRMFNRVDNRPNDDFRSAFTNAGELEFEDFQRTLQDKVTDISKTIDEKERRRENVTQEKISLNRLTAAIHRYSDEKTLRENMHDINRAVVNGIGTQKLSEFAQYFQAHFADLAFNKKAVTTVMHFFEQAMLQVMEENGGYLPNEAMFSGVPTVDDPKRGRVEILVRENIQKAIRMGVIDPEIESWEVKRSISLARGIGIVTGRFIELAAQSKLPKDNLLVSLYAQDIIKDIAPMRHVLGKFNAGKEKLRVLGYKIDPEKRKDTIKDLVTGKMGLKEFIENQFGLWSKDELTSLKDNAMADVINGLVPNSEKRFLSVLNPFKIGSLFTKTGWRYGTDPHSTATWKILESDKTNVRLGTGMWIEKERGNLGSNATPKEEEQIVFGVRVKTKGERARLIITKNLERVADVQPLKLFYNFPEVKNYVQAQLGKTIKDADFQESLSLLALVQEKNLRTEKTSGVKHELDFSDIPPERVEMVKRIASLAKKGFYEIRHGGKNQLEIFMENLQKRDWELPFNFGTDDVPFEEYRFVETGSTSIARRWRDIASESNAAKGLSDLVSHMESYHNQGAIIEKLRVIYDGVSGYDEGLAKELMLNFSEGIIKFYKKDWNKRLPFGLGTLSNIIEGKASYAQLVFGRTAMAWDELDIDEFIHNLHSFGMLPDNEKLIHKFKKRVGGERKNIFAAITRTATSLAVLAFAFYMLKKVTEEK